MAEKWRQVTDSIGQPIEVGDVVIAQRIHYSEIKIYVVTKRKPASIWMEWEKLRSRMGSNSTSMIKLTHLKRSEINRLQAEFPDIKINCIPTD